MAIDRVEHDGFSSGAAKGRMGPPRYIGGAMKNAAYRGAGRLRHRYNPPVRAGGILVKAGLCAAVCAGVLLLRWAQAPQDVIPVGSLRQSAQGAEAGLPYDDSLGRLQFVELPSIIEVFASAAGPNLGLDFEAASLDSESMVATLSLNHSQSLGAPGACRVKVRGQDPALGAYVRLAMADADAEVVYYGLTDISVEEGQQLNLGDTLAQIDTQVHLAVYEAGRPTDPLEYFGLEAGKV